MSYVPRFFLAATLFFVALDLMLEWLVLAHRKMCAREWAVVWLSFLAINLVSLDVGMLIGVGVAVVNFMLSYVQVRGVNPRVGSSFELQTLTKNAVLTRTRGAIAHFEFRGYLFFGSVVQILEGVQNGVYIRKSTNATADDRQSFLPTCASPHSIAVECLDGTPASNAHASPTEFVVMDFGHVSGMDATAARGAFLILKKYCRNRGITVVFAGVLPRIRKLLLKNDVASEESFYATAEAAIKFCETHLSARSTFEAHDRVIEPVNMLLQRFMGEPKDSRPVLDGVDQFFRKVEIPTGHEFYRVAQSPDAFYLLARGRVAISKNADGIVEPDKTLTQLKTVGPSSIFGEVAFFSQQRRYTAATAMEPCTVYEMTREQFEVMKEQTPALSIRLRDVMALAITITNSAEVVAKHK